ncbi:arylesterase domain-containing protein [Hirsutella rhossiliensis]|uniref:Arylesterase domain-containing protein n=1 Tax=Hirsutella rhossiliensis TaxID=111463 RepID=A0A9P8MKX0_9HYPO|nr:arylesterase domain-containing protein [Hirsutella rhossiliensis]KAH0956904.1 arylesterase domain-containing protein [Hirsutella rhossiliensis]
MTLVLGVFRTPASQDSIQPKDVSIIGNTLHCEDLHYHEASKLLFTACEDVESTRYSWFPPLANFNNPTAASKARGNIRIIDPRTLKARALHFENFEPPFVTHGIDIIDDPSRRKGEAVYVFAVNHKPSREHFQKANASAPKSYSVVEVFHYVIGSDTVRHVRSVWDPLIATPNDILALSPTSFFVTNDHYYRDGWLRMLEDLYYEAKWSTTLYVEFSASAGSPTDDSYNVKASVALAGLHNNNGLGHGKTSQDVLLGSAASGVLHLGTFEGMDSNSTARRIDVVESIELDSTLTTRATFRTPSRMHI